ncbi:MAG: Gfo/Idh/MocA family oxidoreductase [Planctomycetota bacterium]|nr:Gfo/Idh/MocA family oxidoreductase [Planctomycetota bacterium]
MPATYLPKDLRQSWPRPSDPRPIVVIGAGGIVNDAHLPAYAKAGFTVAGIYDLDPARAQATAAKFKIPRVFDSLPQAAATPDCVFDIAVPPEAELAVASKLPEGSVVLLQKPMGPNLVEARRIRDLCRQRGLIAAVNFQLRFAPMMLVIRDALDRGLLGEILDVEVRLHVRTPWELFPFLKKLPRVEIAVHSVHYLDLIRGFLGEPRGVYAKTIGHPEAAGLANTRSSVILDYGQATRVSLAINHHSLLAPENEVADVTLQGTRGSASASLGLLMDYPKGKAETARICARGEPWEDVPLQGRWFPDGFVGTMSNLQRFVAGQDDKLMTHFEDAFRTMAVVEAAYESDRQGGIPPANE